MRFASVRYPSMASTATYRRDAGEVRSQANVLDHILELCLSRRTQGKRACNEEWCLGRFLFTSMLDAVYLCASSPTGSGETGWIVASTVKRQSRRWAGNAFDADRTLAFQMSVLLAAPMRGGLSSSGQYSLAVRAAHLRRRTGSAPWPERPVTARS